LGENWTYDKIIAICHFTMFYDILKEQDASKKEKNTIKELNRPTILIGICYIYACIRIFA
jgi:hypothetical protein